MPQLLRIPRGSPPWSSGRVTRPSVSHKAAGIYTLLEQGGLNAERTRKTLLTQGFRELIAPGLQRLLREQLQLEV